jgi:soluble lytic murein transglycosylase-like protein
MSAVQTSVRQNGNTQISMSQQNRNQVGRRAEVMRAIALAFAAIVWSGTALGQTRTAPAKTPVESQPAFSTPNESCIVPAANHHRTNPWVLRAILRVESALKPSALGKNSNGTYDIGIGQINSIHLKELSKFGITEDHLMDACIGTYVAAWRLKKAMDAGGNTWEAIARYHSTTPKFNQRYQVLLFNELKRAGVIDGQAQPVPQLQSPAQRRSGDDEVADALNSMTVFDK